eukprot:1403016-Amphidinium_carterae.1
MNGGRTGQTAPVFTGRVRRGRLGLHHFSSPPESHRHKNRQVGWSGNQHCISTFSSQPENATTDSERCRTMFNMSFAPLADAGSH